MARDPRAAQPVTGRGVDDVVQQTTNVIAPRDRVRWGPIWAGLLTALTLSILGTLLATAIGAATVDNGNADPNNAGRITGIAIPIIAALAFGFGGAIASGTAAVRGRGNGALNGFLVWGLGLPLLLFFATQGLGALLGSAGDIFGQLRGLDASRLQGGAQQAAGQAQRVNPQQVADNIKNGAGSAFLGLGIPAAASTIGGIIGARDRHDGFGENV